MQCTAAVGGATQRCGPTGLTVSGKASARHGTARHSTARHCTTPNGACSTQHAMCSMQHATCSMQHATCSTQHARTTHTEDRSLIVDCCVSIGVLRTRSWCRCGGGKLQSRCRCDGGEPSPGADVGRGEPSPGADVGRGEPSPQRPSAASSCCKSAGCPSRCRWRAAGPRATTFAQNHRKSLADNIRVRVCGNRFRLLHAAPCCSKHCVVAAHG